MLNPCSTHIDCPTGTGTDTSGVNYSSEHVDTPEWQSVYYPPVPGYGTFTACAGRCVSLVSQQDADLCAQRLGKLCLNENIPAGPNKGPGDTPKQTFPNTPQVCTEPNTGRTVIVPAGVIYADSQGEANAQALSLANKMQKDPATPPGPNLVPPPSTNPTPGISVNTIPTPTPHRHQEPPPPTSQCKPCDDTVGVTSFDVLFDVPDASGDILQYSPRLKCGQWRFWITTGTPAPPGAAATYVTANLCASDPSHTLVDWASLEDCPQMAWQSPCGHGDDCTPQDVGEYGVFPGCCDTNDFHCKYAQCQTIDLQHYLVQVQIQFVCPFPEFELAHQFTFHGEWLSALPTAPDSP